MLNASNFSRNASVNAAKKIGLADFQPPKGNRKTRRKATAVARLALTSGYLDKLNEQQEVRVLHPTKGWRKINIKRTVASTIVEMARQGFLGSTQDMKEAFANA
ncbi:hypothetical protein [Mesorhizobium sp.]|uniref:hypothetical protein n=1 Tax=Mesorhizobium sp. TaxID=1871066 RepID=UPI000FE6C86E|nr:hypothetical protein [Mesorhizobium sp.]RWM84332.1 MAG: hypothetical protein EOR83_17070 [Mesorhizobium sp.]